MPMSEEVVKCVNDYVKWRNLGFLQGQDVPDTQSLRAHNPVLYDFHLKMLDVYVELAKKKKMETLCR